MICYGSPRNLIQPAMERPPEMEANTGEMRAMDLDSWHSDHTWIQWWLKQVVYMS